MAQKPTWMSERAWALCNAKNEREYDRLVRQFHREDAEKNWKPMRKYSAEEIFGNSLTK